MNRTTDRDPTELPEANVRGRLENEAMGGMALSVLAVCLMFVALLLSVVGMARGWSPVKPLSWAGVGLLLFVAGVWIRWRSRRPGVAPIGHRLHLWLLALPLALINGLAFVARLQATGEVAWISALAALFYAASGLYDYRRTRRALAAP